MSDSAFEALWKAVLDRWEEERAHGAFLEYAGTTDQLAEAAARYRGMKGDHERSRVAEQRLAGIAIVALAKLEATRRKRPPASRNAWSLIIAGAFGVLAAAVLAYLLSGR